MMRKRRRSGGGSFPKLLLLPLLLLLLLGATSKSVEGRLSGHKLPYYPSEFKTTVQILDHRVVRSVDRVSHRVRIDNLQENVTTLILAARNELYVFNHEECNRTPFLGRFDQFMDSIPENTTYHTRAKAQTFMCEVWRYRDSQHCINYFLTYDVKYTHKQSPFSLQEGGGVSNIDNGGEVSIAVLPKLKEPLPPITLVQITVHPSERCNDKALRTIDFFDFVAIKHESKTFEPPPHCRSNNATRPRYNQKRAATAMPVPPTSTETEETVPTNTSLSPLPSPEPTLSSMMTL